MTWTDARAELRTILTGLGRPFFVILPTALDAKGAVIALIPPGRTEERRASGVVRTTYAQVIRVMAFYPSNEDTAELARVADEVDTVVEQINVALRGSLTLDGHAAAVSAPDWDEMTPVEWPANSDILYLAMDGTIQIEVETVGSFGV